MTRSIETAAPGTEAQPECIKGLIEALTEIAGLPELSKGPVDDFDRGARATRLDAAEMARAALAKYATQQPPVSTEADTSLQKMQRIPVSTETKGEGALVDREIATTPVVDHETPSGSSQLWKYRCHCGKRFTNTYGRSGTAYCPKISCQLVCIAVTPIEGEEA